MGFFRKDKQWKPFNILNVMGSISGILGFLLSALNVYADFKVPIFFIIRDLLLFSSILVFSLICLLTAQHYKRRFLEMLDVCSGKDKEMDLLAQKEEERCIKIVKRFQNVIVKNCSIAHNGNKVLKQVPQDPCEEFNIDYYMKDYHRDLYSSGTTLLRKLVLDFFKIKNYDEDCAVTIKIVSPKDSSRNILDWEVITAYRDENAKSQNSREIKENEYIIKENTAFRRLAYETEPYFCGNNLKELDGYANQTNGWEKYYNATFVVPIMHYDLLIGFLAVDSLNKSKKDLFQPEWCYKIMSGVAGQISIMMSFFTSINDQAELVRVSGEFEQQIKKMEIKLEELKC